MKQIMSESMIDLTTALEKNLWSLWSHFGRGPKCTLVDKDGVLRFDTPIPTLPYNAVIRFNVAADIDRRIDEIFQHYADRNVPFLWILTPTASPKDLDKRLEMRGFIEIEVCPGMCCSLSVLPSDYESNVDGIQIREVSAVDTDAIFELVTWRWGVPVTVKEYAIEIYKEFRIGTPEATIRIWAAWKDDVPVAKAVLHYAGGVAGLHGVVTKPEFRGLGLARSLTLHAFHQAARAGYTTGVLHSSPAAQSLYASLGFESVAPFRLFAAPGGFHV